MSEKKAKGAASSSKRNKKQTFDPFVRLGTCTAPLPPQGSAPAPQTVFPAEFIDSALTISPALPKTEVMLKVQFRCTVDLAPGDALTLHLPGFKGPKPRVFSLESLPHPDGLNTARYFTAYWVGDSKPKKVKGMVGMPSKQTVMLRCLRRVEENTLVIFAIPLALGLVTPEKLAANSAKVKIEGNAMKHAEGGKSAKQAFLSCTGVKKTPVAEELEVYEQVMSAVVESGSLSKEDRAVAEELLLEDVEQLIMAVTTPLTTASSSSSSSAGNAAASGVSLLPRPPCRQRPYPIAMPWAMVQKVFHAYEDAGAFVKTVMENSIRFIKKHDPLAVHREVATNWGVKVGAVVVLEDLLALQYGTMYPTISRTALLAAHLLTMEPVDVGRTFPVTELPKLSLQQELLSAFRMQDTLSTLDPASAACGVPSRCEAILHKWTAVLSVLLTAVMPVSADAAADPSAAAADADDIDRPDGGNPARSPARVRFTTPGRADSESPGGGGGSTTDAQPPVLLTPPPLFTGLREVPADELQAVRELRDGDWYVFPNLVVAQERCPVASLSASAAQSMVTSSEEAATKGGAAQAVAADANHRSAAAPAADGEEEAEGEGDGDASAIPDSSVLFEIRRTVEALELADLSLYPYSRQWLLPFSSSFRVVSVTTHADLNDLTHVVLDMVGSLTGEIADLENVPEGDRAVARMVVRKLRVECENSESKLPSIARLSYLNVRRNDRRRLHPPTLMRAQYLANFQEVRRASEAARTLESGVVQWQVCLHPAQMLDEGVVKPAAWEPLPARYTTTVEQLFLSRTRTKLRHEDGALIVDLAAFTIDYAGKGPRLIRRLVDRKVTHEPGLEDGTTVYDETKERAQAAAAQLATLNAKLGLAPNGQPLSAPAGGAENRSAGQSGKAAASGNKAKRAAAVKAA